MKKLIMSLGLLISVSEVYGAVRNITSQELKQTIDQLGYSTVFIIREAKNIPTDILTNSLLTFFPKNDKQALVEAIRNLSDADLEALKIKEEEKQRFWSKK